MTEPLDKQRRTNDRRSDPPTSGRIPLQTPERGTLQKGTPDVVGNSGTFVGTETRNGVEFARYRAVKGTWVSASLVEQGYDKVWNRDVAYGAYLGVVRDPNGSPLKTPDKIVPGQEYLIPTRTSPTREMQTITFPEQPITGFRSPPKPKLVEPFVQKEWERNVKDALVALRDLPFGTFELRGPEPPSRVPEEAVAHWLKLHQPEIERAEKKWRVSRLAIAGAIAWEALVNPQASSLKSSSAAKIHIQGTGGHLSWLQGLELTGRAKVRTPGMWRTYLANHENAIDTLGAIFDLIAVVGEEKGWNLRNSYEILTHVYHFSSPDGWLAIIKAKKPGEGFGIQPGGMGHWVQNHWIYLQKAVGVPEKW